MTLDGALYNINPRAKYQILTLTFTSNMIFVATHNQLEWLPDVTRTPGDFIGLLKSAKAISATYFVPKRRQEIVNFSSTEPDHNCIQICMFSPRFPLKFTAQIFTRTHSQSVRPGMSKVKLILWKSFRAIPPCILSEEPQRHVARKSRTRNVLGIKRQGSCSSLPSSREYRFSLSSSSQKNSSICIIGQIFKERPRAKKGA